MSGTPTSIPTEVWVAAVALRNAYTRGIEPDVTDVMTVSAWMSQNVDVSEDVEKIMQERAPCDLQFSNTAAIADIQIAEDH